MDHKADHLYYVSWVEKLSSWCILSHMHQSHCFHLKQEMKCQQCCATDQFVAEQWNFNMDEFQNDLHDVFKLNGTAFQVSSTALKFHLL